MMVRTKSDSKLLSFAISHGFVGGPAHSRQLRKLLRAAGFRLTSLAEADIIIAHSAGCWLMPDSATPKLVMYIGMPLATARPSRTLARANLGSFRYESVIGNIGIRLKNMYYSLRQPRRNLKIMRNTGMAESVTFPAAQSVFIANQHDPWPQAKRLQSYINDYDWAFISLNGAHDNVWQRPERYVAIINHYARLLAQTNR